MYNANSQQVGDCCSFDRDASGFLNDVEMWSQIPPFSKIGRRITEQRQDSIVSTTVSDDWPADCRMESRRCVCDNAVAVSRD